MAILLVCQRVPRALRTFPHTTGEYSPAFAAARLAAAANAAKSSDNPAVSCRGIAVAFRAGMITRERVESVLDRVRPFMQADGGDIELLDVDGNSADVRLSGMCAGCPSAHMTLYLGVETALREEMPEFETLRLR